MALEPIDEGNLRLASVSLDGWPEDLQAQRRILDELVADKPGVEVAGPLTLLIDMPPAGDTPDEWQMQAGLPITGLLKAKAPLIVEDFHHLQALTVPHHGPRGEIGATYQQLAEQARAFNWFLRPYWRVSISMQRLSDQALHPQTMVSVFLDR